MNNFYDSLSDKIYNNNEFIKVYTQFCKDVTLISLNQKSKMSIDMAEIKKMIETAAIFSLATDKYKEIALKILNGLLICNVSEEFITPVKLILSRLGNFPTANLLKGYIDFKKIETLSLLDFNLRMEIESKYKNNYLTENITLTDFQAELLKSLSKKESISFSAPTSAGKTYVLTEHVCRNLKRDKPVNVCIIVPTKALISQLFMDFSKKIEEEDIKGTNIFTTTSQLERLSDYKHSNNLFILTQERLQYLLYFDPTIKIKFDILIVDEAQKIGDDSRGVILETAILEVINQNPNAQIICSAPLAKNPERFSTILNHKQKVIQSNLSPVPQFIYDVRIFRRKLQLKVVLNGNLVDVENNITFRRPNGVYKELASIAYYLGKEDMNIVFANGPNAAVELADALLEYTREEKFDEVEEFLEYLKDEIHPLYKLRKYLSHGIGFHYSAMPLTIRTKVEELFKLQKIRFLCCTSTLLEGVNLPARNIFIRKPQEGNGRTMSEESFWNLIGRAGRLRQEFSGNIFCVNTREWDKDLINSNRNYFIVSATENTITKHPEKFLDYLDNYHGTIDKRMIFESCTSAFVRRRITNNNDNIINYVMDRDIKIDDPDKILEMDRRVLKIINQIRIPLEVLQRNSTIDPRKQQKLLDFFLINKDGLSKFMPIHPLNKDFYNNLKLIFKTIDNILVGVENNSSEYLALIGVLWIKETPLKEIINRQIDYKTKNKSKEEMNYLKNDEKFVNRIIEDLVNTINDKLVFQYARYTQCYIDLLNMVLKKLGKQELDYALPASIEYGTSNHSSLITITKGGSRSLAIRLTTIYKSSSNLYGELEFEEWINRNKGSILNALPKSMHDEFLNIYN